MPPGCVNGGNTAETCASWGMDCTCLAQTCVDPCLGCVGSGNAVDACSSWGMDCAGCVTQPPQGGCTDDPDWVATGHPSWNCATYAPGGINAGACEIAVADDGRTASEGCLATCESCGCLGEKGAALRTDLGFQILQ